MIVPSNEVRDILEHSGVKGMRWGVRRSEGGSKQTSKKVKVGKNLTKAVGTAMGIHHGKPNAKLNSKSERAVGNVLHYTIVATSGSSVATPNHRRIGEDKNVTKGKKVVEKHLDQVVRIGSALGGLI